MDIDVTHDKETQTFYSVIDGKKALLDYSQPEPSVLNFYHTYVPPEFRGQNIAGQILFSASQYAKENHYRVIASCSYAERYLRRHKEFTELLEDS